MKKLLKGEVSLASVFWGYFLGITIVLSVLSFLLSLFFGAQAVYYGYHNAKDESQFATFLAVAVLFIPYIWSLISLVLVYINAENTSRGIYQTLARSFVIVYAVTSLFSLILNFF